MSKTKRRGRGEGTIFKRSDGIWCAGFTTGYGEDGVRKQKRIYGKTKREVREKLQGFQQRVSQGLTVDIKKIRFKQFIEDWCELIALPKYRKSTYSLYTGIIRRNINPHLGGLNLSVIKPNVLQRYYQDLQKAKVGPRICQLIHVILSKSFAQALDWGYLTQNPCHSVNRPRNARKTMRVLSTAEVKEFLLESKNTPHHALFLLAVTTGLRQGELFSLTWEDVNFADKTISVQKTVYEVDGEFVLGEPKTAKSRRLVTVPWSVLETLRQHKLNLEQKNIKSDIVFCDLRGGYLRRQNFRKRQFLPLLKKADLPMIRFHDLRHTAATLLLSQGVHPKVVQERLGHSQINTTLDTYSHVLPSMQEEAAGKLEKLFVGF